MNNTNIFKNKMTDIANAIRETGKTSDLLAIDEMPAKIKLIPSDGGYYTMDDFGYFMASGNFPEGSTLFIDGQLQCENTYATTLNLPFTFDTLRIKKIYSEINTSTSSTRYISLVANAQGNKLIIDEIISKSKQLRLLGGNVSSSNLNFHKIILPYLDFTSPEKIILAIGYSHIVELGEKRLYYGNRYSDFSLYLSAKSQADLNSFNRAIVFRGGSSVFAAFRLLSTYSIPNKFLTTTYIFIPDSLINTNWHTDLINSLAGQALADTSTQIKPLSEYREEDF